MKTYKDGRMEQTVTVRHGLKSFFERRGEAVNAAGLGRFIARWQRVLEIGEKELSETFGKAIERVVCIIAAQVRADRMNADDFWALSGHRIGAIVGLEDETLGKTCFELSEMALLALKDRVNSIVPMVTGKGGRHAEERGEQWGKAGGKKSHRHR